MKKETMICPFCGYELLTGEIQTGQGIDFTYETGPSEYQEHTPKKERLAIGSWMRGTRLDAYACKRCNKLIVDCDFYEKKFDIKKILGCDDE